MTIILSLPGRSWRSLVRGRHGSRVVIWTGLQSQLHDDSKTLIISSSCHHHCSHRTKLHLGLKGSPGSRQLISCPVFSLNLLSYCSYCLKVFKDVRSESFSYNRGLFLFYLYSPGCLCLQLLTLKSVMNVLFCFPWSSILQGKLSQFQYHRII